MSFEGQVSVGDRVESVDEEGVHGTVKDVFCDYGDHKVAVEWDDEEARAEIGYEILEESVRLLEDPYEYNIESTDLITGLVWICRDLWEPDMEWLSRRISESELHDRKLLNAGGQLEYTRRLVKRRKAGKVEDV